MEIEISDGLPSREYMALMGDKMSANDRQVGGDHYRSVYQHWDWCVDHNVRHLEGSATKYVLRHSKKNGRQDLEKALHYVAKIRECIVTKNYRNEINQCEIGQNTIMMIVTADLLPGGPEHQIITLLGSWQVDGDLWQAETLIKTLLERYDAVEA